MNAISSIPPKEKTSLERAGHSFRVQFIDICATIEEWASLMLAECDQVKKSNHLFGQKIKAVHEIATATPSRFRHRERVLDLLAKLQPLAELRNKLAHARQIAATQTDEGPLIIFRAAQETTPYKTGILLNAGEMKTHLRDLADIAKQLRDQSLKPKAS
jgi:hypothetical protein